MRLSEFATQLSISYSTALRMFKKQQIPGAFKLPTGTIVVPDDVLAQLRETSEAANSSLEHFKKMVRDRFNESVADQIIDLIDSDPGGEQ